MTVWVTKQPLPDSKGWLPDLSPALKFGALRYVFMGTEKVFALPAPSLHKARRILLKEFVVGQDYLLHPNAQDQMALICCLTAIQDLRPEFINILYFDRIRQEDGSRNRRLGAYYPIRFEMRKKAA